MQVLNHPVPAARPSREFAAAFFFSVLFHVFITCLLWNVANKHAAVDTASSLIGTPLIVSLTTLPDSSSDGLVRKSEGEINVTGKNRKELVLKTPDGMPRSLNTTPAIDMDALNRMDFNFGNIPEFKTKAVDAILNQGGHGSGASGASSFTHYLTSSYGLESVKRFEQVFGEMSESELQKKIEWRVDYIKKYEASLPPDCSTYYGSGGLLAIPIIIKDVITHNNRVCMW